MAESKSMADKTSDLEPVALEGQLPTYARSLLRIEVPVSVTLAARRQPVSQIISLGPGSILQFSKSCEEPLEVSVGGECVAHAEAVKVGDRYGVRITSMVLPEERLTPLRAAPALAPGGHAGTSGPRSG